MERYLLQNPISGASQAKVAQLAGMQHKQVDTPSYGVDTLDRHFHRGTPQKRIVVADPTINPRQDKVTKSLRDYLSQKIDKDEFYGELIKNNVEITDQITAYVHKQESGDTPKFKDFGKVVLRSLNGAEMYNRVDKINVAD